MNHSPTIVLTGGGSGGHITPLLSLAHELKELDPNAQIVYVGHKGDRFDSLKESSKDFDFVSFIDSGKFRRYHGESLGSHLVDIKTLALNFRDFFKVIASIGKAWHILRKTKPDVIFSKGGFVVVPVGIAAKLLGIPIITHDSDTIPGLANRIVGRWAKVNATGMPAKYYKYPAERVSYVGVPVSSADFKPLAKGNLTILKKKLGLAEDSLVLLVAGGGNGSQRLNNLMTSIAPHLLKSNLALQIIHIAGQQHQSGVEATYASTLSPIENKRVKVLGFTSDFAKYATVADLIFSRAGATSIAEFALLGKACIIMPSPFLAGGHQLRNAEELAHRGAAVVVDEQTDADELLVIVSELLNNDRRRNELATNLQAMAKPKAANELAKIILQTTKGDN